MVSYYSYDPRFPNYAVSPGSFNPALSPVGQYYRTSIGGMSYIVLYVGYTPATGMVMMVALLPTGLQLMNVHHSDLVGWTIMGPNLVLQKTDPLCATYSWAIGC
ncbi:hypothetical protein B5M42_004715 [Paenibacillus athensensis]|uniref:hypothetical protein n=1 Tax=Paenibacillus athensensis TaxID=1967502 RepID=UPI00106F5C5D|nr:hypothetical protein [Paenibacillus athensensis]MCD1258141.1 hypothetical protein [Paenibacillus athensensis]